MVGLTQVEPYKSPLLLQMVGDLLNGEVLDLEPAVTPPPSADAVLDASDHRNILH
jgi:hypothetical protein